MKVVSRLGVAALAVALATGLSAPAAVAGDAPVARAVAHKKPAYKVTIKASRAIVESTTKVVLSGRVRPAPQAGRVLLRKRIGESVAWTKEAWVKTSRTGRFTYTDQPSAPGVRRYRVYVPKSKHVRAVNSKAVKVTVVRWRSLASTPFRATDSTELAWDGVTIDRTRYAPAFVSAPGAVQGTADWNIPAACIRMRVRTGNADGAELGSIATISLNGGPGQFAYTNDYALRASAYKVFDVRRVFRVSYAWKSSLAGSPEPAAGAQPVMVADLLCSTR